MTKRELTAWILVAFMFGSVTTPIVGAQDRNHYGPILWAIRSAIANNCEVAAFHANQRSTHDRDYDPQRCWR